MCSPLILDDGTVYGVVGVELLTSYLTTQLPSNELQNTDHGTYLLATTDADLKRDDVINVRTAFLTGEDADKNMPQTPYAVPGMEWTGSSGWMERSSTQRSSSWGFTAGTHRSPARRGF